MTCRLRIAVCLLLASLLLGIDLSSAGKGSKKAPGGKRVEPKNVTKTGQYVKADIPLISCQTCVLIAEQVQGMKEYYRRESDGAKLVRSRCGSR